MSLKTRLAAALAPLAVAFTTAVAAAPPGAPAKPATPFNYNLLDFPGHVSVGIGKGCEHLPGKDCDGTSKSVRFVTDDGFSLEVRQVQDTMTRNNFNWSRTALDKLHLNARTDEYLRIESTTLHAKQIFKPFENTQLQLGGYAGYVEGQARFSANASAALDAFSIKIPQIKHDGKVLYEGKTIDVPAMDKTLYAREVAREAKSPYGGLTQAAGWGHDLGSIGGANVALRLGQSVRAGFDEVSGRAGASLLVASGRDMRSASRPLGETLSSSAKYAVEVGVEFGKVWYNKLYEAEKDLADRQVARYDAKATALENQADRVLSRVEEHIHRDLGRPAIPRINQTQVLNFLGIDNAYKVQTSVTLQGSMRVGENGRISAYAAKDVSGNNGSSFGVIARYDF